MPGDDFSPQARRRQQVEAREALREALRAVGCELSPHGVLKLLADSGAGRVVPSEKTIERWLEYGPPLRPTKVTRDYFSLIAKATKQPKKLDEAVSKLWSARTKQAEQPDHPQARAYDEMLEEAWFAIIPVQPGRSYASIDRVVIEDQDHPRVSGHIRRISPPREAIRNLEWSFEGIRYGREGLFALFMPSGGGNDKSRGVIAVRWDGFRSPTYTGLYARLPEENDGSSTERDFGGLLLRRYGWYPNIPQSALHRVALLDLDNTLRPDWSIKGFVEFLEEDDFKGAARCRERIETALDTYYASVGTDDHFPHDRLAQECASAYAEMLEGQPREELLERGRSFASSHLDMYPFVAPLIARLGELGVAPILVSGAPDEVVAEFARRLRIEEYVGLTLGVEADGTYSGAIAQNPGLREMKRAVTRDVKRHERLIVLAVGDSDSDLPLWQEASHQIVVGSLGPDDRAFPNALRIDPTEEDVGETVVSWIGERLASDVHLSVEENASHSDLVMALQRQAKLRGTKRAPRRDELADSPDRY